MDKLNRLCAALMGALGTTSLQLDFDGRQWTVTTSGVGGIGLNADEAIADALRLLKNAADARTESARAALVTAQGAADSLASSIAKATVSAAPVDAIPEAVPMTIG